MDERLPIRGTGDELDKLSLTINRFLDLIADYLERNREFVANAAHELRSPLAAIQSSVDVTLNSERSVAEYQDLLVEIADECGQLGVLGQAIAAVGRDRHGRGSRSNAGRWISTAWSSARSTCSAAPPKSAAFS